MSADNGVYITRWKAQDGSFEYRVAHCQAIDNCDADDNYAKELIDAYRALYFGNSEIYKSREDALVKASEIYDEIMKDDFCPICEYGISFINYDAEFPDMTVEDAYAFISSFNSYCQDNLDADMRFMEE